MKYLVRISFRSGLKSNSFKKTEKKKPQENTAEYLIDLYMGNIYISMKIMEKMEKERLINLCVVTFETRGQSTKI